MSRYKFSFDQESTDTSPSSTKCFSTEGVPSYEELLKDKLSKGQIKLMYQEINRILSAYHNTDRLKHDGEASRVMDNLKDKYQKGYPWGTNSALYTHATPILVSICQALSDRIVDVTKVRFGRDIGRIDG